MIIISMADDYPLENIKDDFKTVLFKKELNNENIIDELTSRIFKYSPIDED